MYIIHSCIHSGHFYSAPSPLQLRGAPDYSTDTVSEFHAEAHGQLQIENLPKVPTWRLERESNARGHDPPVESHRLNQGATTSFICSLCNVYVYNVYVYNVYVYNVHVYNVYVYIMYMYI